VNVMFDPHNRSVIGMLTRPGAGDKLQRHQGSSVGARR
jgi:hypothetical protein